MFLDSIQYGCLAAILETVYLLLACVFMDALKYFVWGTGYSKASMRHVK